MRVLLKGYYGFGNLGDDILLKTTWGVIQATHKQVTIDIFSNFNKNLASFDREKLYNEYIFTIVGSKAKLVDWTSTESYDLLVDGGGGVYFDNKHGGITKSILNYLTRFLGASIIHLVDRVLRKLLKREKKIKFNRRIGIGIGIGPYSRDSSLLYHHLTEIGSTNVLLVRDQTSLNLLQKLKYRGKKYLTTDIAFLTQYWLPDGIVNKPKKFEGNLGIILLDLDEKDEERFQVFKMFANWAIESNYSVTFFSLDENNDKKYSDKFISHFKLEIWQPSQRSLKEFLLTLSAQHVVFSARAHGVIISTILGIPTVSIGASKKLIEVSKMFPNSCPLIREPVSLSLLQNSLIQLIDNYSNQVSLLEVDVSTNKRIALDALRWIN
jgi:polysaccharide pyruvyl transferase WcaK-like protein